MYVAQMPGFRPAPLDRSRISTIPRQYSRERSPLPRQQEHQDMVTKATAPQVSAFGKDMLLTVVGGCILALIVLTPVWDCVRLLWSSTYVYFIGRTECFWCIVFCACVVLFFIIAMLLVTGCGRYEVKSGQTFMFLVTLTFTVLGVGLLMFSVPISMKSKAVYNELMVSCSSGATSAPLYAYYHTLLNLRMNASCIGLDSIEDCSGYEERQPYTGYLKEMELSYKCSGFCYQASNVKNASRATRKKNLALASMLPHRAAVKDEAANDFVGMLQTTQYSFVPPVLPSRLLPEESSGLDVVQSVVQITTGTFQRPASRKAKNKNSLEYNPESTKTIQGLFQLAANRNKTTATKASNASTPTKANSTKETTATKANSETTVAKADPANFTAPHRLGDTINNMEGTGWMEKYPPTLFTTANYKTTCEGEAAREMRFAGEEVGFVMYMGGSFILVVSVILGFARFCGMTKATKEPMESAHCGAKKVVL